MKKNKLFMKGVLVAALIVLGATNAAAQVTPPDSDFEVTQNTDGKTLTINDYKGTAKNIIIPATLYGLPVTVIGKKAFDRKGLIGVAIPEGVITIEDNDAGLYYGNGAFAHNKLTSIIIPDSITTIGRDAFFENKLTSVTIGNRVAVIGGNAFRGSLNIASHTNTNDGNQLTSVTIPNSVTTIGEGAFGNNQLASVTMGNRVTTIGEEAFLRNQLTSISIPNGVTTIGPRAFDYNQLTSLTIPGTVSQIGNYAFRNNRLTSITFGKGVMIAYAWRGDGWRGIDAFRGNPLTSITIANEMTLIGNLGFEENFLNFYESQGRTPGTYVKNGPIWSKK